MIRWCSWCKTYLGESPPWQSYQFTHALCAKCRRSVRFDDPAITEDAHRLSLWYAQLRLYAKKGNVDSFLELINQASDLKVKPLDLMIGVVQPILYEIGDLWARGSVTVAHEHQFTSVALTLLTAVYSHYKELEGTRRAHRGDILLANAEGNYHTLGIQLVALSLASRSIPHDIAYPGLPTREIVDLVKRQKPKILGISIALPTQLKSVRELAEGLQSLPSGERPEMFIGGIAVRDGLLLPKELNISVCTSLFEFPGLSDDEELVSGSDLLR